VVLGNPTNESAMVSVMPLPSGLALPSTEMSAPAVPAAPPEAIPLEPAAIKQAFLAAGPARFLDLSGRFSFDDRAKLSTAVHELSKKTDAKVWVLALPGKTDVNSYASIHNELKMQQRDVLFIFSADKRHLHSQAIPKSVGSDILKETNKEFYRSQSSGILQMLDAIAVRIGTTTTVATTAAPASTTAAPAAARRMMVPIEWVLIAIAVAVIGVLLFKTRRPSKPPGPRVSSRPEVRGDDDARP
jgi:hypothetical protein